MNFKVKDLFKELKVECNVVELDLIGKFELRKKIKGQFDGSSSKMFY